MKRDLSEFKDKWEYIKNAMPSGGEDGLEEEPVGQIRIRSSLLCFITTLIVLFSVHFNLFSILTNL